MMTTKEYELVEYLKQHPVVMNNTVLVGTDTVEKSISFLLENGITILSMSFVILSENGVDKVENTNISYLENPASFEKIMNDINSTVSTYTHIEISIRLKNQP